MASSMAVHSRSEGGMTETIDLRSRASFRHWSSVGIRYCDQDPLGHLNNGAMAAFLEQARVELIQPLVKAAGRERLDIVLARVIIDYVDELTYPGHVEIGTRVAHIGTKSFRLVHGVFRGGTERCAGTGECVLVLFDLNRRASVALPADIRAALTALR